MSFSQYIFNIMLPSTSWSSKQCRRNRGGNPSQITDPRRHTEEGTKPGNEVVIFHADGTCGQRPSCLRRYLLCFITFPLAGKSDKIFFHQGPKSLLAAQFPSPFPSFFLTKTLYAFVFFPIRATCPDHLISLGSITLMIFSEVYNKNSSCFTLSATNTQRSSAHVLLVMWETMFRTYSKQQSKL